VQAGFWDNLGVVARRAPIFAAARRLVFAHRGGALLAPENTMPAIDNGLALGADGLEIDVQLSADGIPVVIHDRTLDRTTDRTGPVQALTAAELARVDAAFHFTRNGTFPFRGQGIGIPTLDAVLSRHPGTRIIVEMKGGEADLARRVGEAIKRAGAVERVCVGSFYQPSIDVIRAEHPEIVTSASQHEARWALHRSWVRWPFTGERAYCAFQVPEHAGRMRVVSRNFVRYVQREGHAVQVWVVNERADIQRLLDWGVDGIISDVPDVAVAARDDWAARSQ
jgi:glycerophosphoryl diester phosphodiesterase